MSLTEKSRTPLQESGKELVVYQGSDPAADTEISEEVPAGKRWKLIAMRFELVTDANVADRGALIQIGDEAGNLAFELGPTSVQPASETYRYTAAAVGIVPVASFKRIPIGLPAGLVLGPGFTMKTNTINRQVGDNYAAPIFLVEED